MLLKQEMEIKLATQRGEFKRMFSQVQEEMTRMFVEWVTDLQKTIDRVDQDQAATHEDVRQASNVMQDIWDEMARFQVSVMAAIPTPVAVTILQSSNIPSIAHPTSSAPERSMTGQIQPTSPTASHRSFRSSPAPHHVQRDSPAPSHSSTTPAASSNQSMNPSGLFTPRMT